MNDTMVRFDNAGQIYPASMTKKWNCVYRISVYMKDEIKVDLLKRAVCDLAKRFPTFYTQLYKGFNWDYLKAVDNYDIVREETEYPCRPMEVGTSDKPMFRVLYKDKTISLEFFHGVTDGCGSTIYFKTLLARYLELQGFVIEKQFGILDINDAPTEAEKEDAYQALYNKNVKLSRKEPDAYQFLAPRKDNYLNVKSGILPIDKLKELTKLKYNCSMTEYLISVYALSFIQQYRKDTNKKETRKIIRMSVPINMRQFFGSETLRNFASFVNLDIDPNIYKTLPEIIEIVHEQCVALIQKNKLQEIVSVNVADEKRFVTQIAPNFLKKPIMKIGFKLFGERKYTSVISNNGLIKVPASMEEHIENFEYMLGGMQLNRICAVAVGYKNNLTITLSGPTENNEVQDFFFNTIKNDGIVFEMLSHKLVA